MKHKTFIELVGPAKDKMYRLALRLLVSKEAAEDAVQEVLMKLWSRNEKMSTYKNVEAFAMTMTKNYCFDQLKLKQNNNLKIVHNNYEDHKSSPHQILEVDDELNFVKEIVENLPEQQKVIFQLRDVEQYDFEEIAKMLEMNQTAIRVALSRARKTIREEIVKKHKYGIG
ncbi:MAG TPA: sigma-70 family RNA polymerase sigma factor [Salinimicrobium sp.]|nr:sigma-70 family RNA polymerase sigma factor [Salinimicrobium sp.]